jgi:hypothetical protein
MSIVFTPRLKEAIRLPTPYIEGKKMSVVNWMDLGTIMGPIYSLLTLWLLGSCGNVNEEG